MSNDDLFDDLDAVSWDDLGRINQDGYIEDAGSPGEPSIFFEDQFELRSRELQAAPAGMKPVNVYPTKQGPWSGNNQLGIQQEFAPDVNNLQTILKLDEWGMPEPWTVCLGLDYDVNLWIAETGDSLLRSFEVTALIDFGVGGVTQQVEVDWLSGSSITLTMNAVNVRALFNFPVIGEGGAVGTPPSDLKLRVTLSKGPIIHGRPTRSYFFPGDNTDNGFPADGVIIPPFAKAVIITPVLYGAVVNPFDFYNQLGNLSFSSDPIDTFNGATVNVFALSQLINYFDPITGVIGQPIAIPIPPFARSLQLNTVAPPTGLRGCTVQFLIGL